MRLKDKVALITGAGSGIGRQAALLFSREGAAVVAVDVNEKAAQETVGMIQNAIAVKADVSKAADVTPINFRAKFRGKFSEFCGCLTDDQQRVLYCKELVFIMDKTFDVQTRREPFDTGDVVQDVLEALCRIARRHERPQSQRFFAREA